MRRREQRSRPLALGRRLGLGLGLALATCCLLVSLSAACFASAARAASAVPSPFDGTALWIDGVPAEASAQQLAGEAAQAGAHTLFVKAAEGIAPEAQLTPALVAGLRAAGVSVCGWTFVDGRDPLAEAAAAVAAVTAGAQCLVIDAEEEYDGLYGAAQLFVHALRAQLGSRFPIGLAGQAEVLEHPSFPYSVFLGPGGFGFDMPQLYWRTLGVSVAGAYEASIGINSIYGRPILPVGQLFESPPSSELAEFRSLAGAYGAPGTSFFDLDSARPEELLALAAPTARLARRAAVPPTLRAGADGDEVVWVQELLNGAGARLPVGGYFGAQTARALARFQLRHDLPPTGVLGPASWRALLRQRPREPSWAAGPPESASA